MELEYALLSLAAIFTTIMAMFFGYRFLAKRPYLVKKADGKEHQDECSASSPPSATDKKAVRRRTRPKRDSATESEQMLASIDDQEENEDEKIGEEITYGDDPVVEECQEDEKQQDGVSEERDPFEYCEHIQSEVKKIKQKLTTKKIEETLTPNQLDEEREVQKQQLQAIFKLMQQQQGKFGIDSMDDVQTQMHLYG